MKWRAAAAISQWFQTLGGTEKCTRAAMPGQMQAARIAINLTRSPMPRGSRRVVSAHTFESRSSSHLFQHALRSLSDPSASNSHHSLSILNFFFFLFTYILAQRSNPYRLVGAREPRQGGSQRMGCVMHWSSRTIFQRMTKKFQLSRIGFAA